jgi:hypothetical protein
MEAPTIAASATGMSTTRSGPKRAWSPSVARNTPPERPTSSPSTITRWSRSIPHSSVERIASTMLSTGTAQPSPRSLRKRSRWRRRRRGSPA